MKHGPHSKRPRGRVRRSNNNSNGNTNRHYDSNGPDVRIRGTASQIFDKYQNLARDSSSSGDRVSAESYLQHAEHYFRIMLSNNSANGRVNALPGDPLFEQMLINQSAEAEEQDARVVVEEDTDHDNSAQGTEATNVTESSKPLSSAERKPRGRGRPRKNSPPVEENVNEILEDVATTSDESNAVPTEKSSVRTKQEIEAA